jgi:O-antigen/teichoic acid export membrane protein
MSDAAAPRALLANASGALGWSLVNTAATRLGTLGIGIVLARLLGPKEFGTYAVAFVALSAVLAFNELGVSLAIVRWPGDPRAIAPTVTTISLASSSVLAVVGVLAAPAFTHAMGDPAATNVVRLLALSVIVSGAVASPGALLQRSFRQDLRMLIDQVGTWVGALSSVGLAVAGMGAMSLAVGRVAGAAIMVVLFIRFSPEPYRLGLDRTQLGPLLRFGLPLAGASVVVFAVGFADQIVVGHWLGATALGFYVLAFNLSSWPVNMLSQPLRSVAPATFARLQHEPEQMRATFRSLVQVLAAVMLPFCLLLGGAARPIIGFVYGGQWAPAAAALTWLGVLAAIRIFYELVYDYLVVLGVSRVILVLQLLWLAVLIPALLAGSALYGIAGVAAAQVGVAALVMVPLYLWRLRRAGIGALDLLRRVSLPLAAAILVGAVGRLLGVRLHSNIGALLVSGLLALLVVAALLYGQRARLRALRGGPTRTPRHRAPGRAAPRSGAPRHRAGSRVAA